MKKNIVDTKFSLLFALCKLISIFYIIPLFLILGSTGNLMYAYAYSFISIFISFSSTGLTDAVSKMLNKYNNENNIINGTKIFMFSINIILFLILFLSSNALANFIIGSHPSTILVSELDFIFKAVSFYILFTTPVNIYKGYLDNKRLDQSLSISETIEGFIKAILIIFSTLIGLKLFKLEYKYLIVLILVSSFIASLISSIYLRAVIDKNEKKKIIKHKKLKLERGIIFLVLSYSIPFILLDLFQSIILSYDSLYLVRLLITKFNYSVVDAENVLSYLVLYARYINDLILVFITGIIIYFLGRMKKKDLSSRINKSFQIVLIIGLPIIVLLSILSSNLWNIFYGVTDFGGVLYTYYIFIVFFYLLFLICIKNLLELKEYKFTYIMMFIGLFINIILKLPLLDGFNKMGIPPFYGSITSIILGCFIPTIISLIYLHIKYKVNYEDSIKLIIDVLISVLVMGVILILIKVILPSFDSRILNLIVCLINIFIGAIIYLFIINKNGILNKLDFGGNNDIYRINRKRI